MFPSPQTVVKSLATVQDAKTGCCQAFLRKQTTFDGKNSIKWWHRAFSCSQEKRLFSASTLTSFGCSWQQATQQDYCSTGVCSGDSCVFTPPRQICLEETHTWMCILQVEACAPSARWGTAPRRVEIPHGKRRRSLSDGCFQWKASRQVLASGSTRLTKTTAVWQAAACVQGRATRQSAQVMTQVPVFSHLLGWLAWKTRKGLRLGCAHSKLTPARLFADRIALHEMLRWQMASTAAAR